MDAGEKPEIDPEVGVLFRNGNITVFGIVLSFSLGFLNTWANNPNEWQMYDLPTLAFIATGIVFQGWALWRLLRPDSLRRSVLVSGTRTFAVGLLLTATGVIMSIAVDLARRLLL